MPRLDVYSSTALILQVKVKADPVVIGRGTHCDISLIDSSVSRRHALIRPSGQGWELLGQGRNGTRLNGAHFHNPVPLHFGDRIYIGEHALIFQADDAPILKRTSFGMDADTIPPVNRKPLIRPEATPGEGEDTLA